MERMAMVWSATLAVLIVLFCNMDFKFSAVKQVRNSPAPKIEQTINIPKDNGIIESLSNADDFVSYPPLDYFYDEYDVIFMVDDIETKITLKVYEEYVVSKVESDTACTLKGNNIYINSDAFSLKEISSMLVYDKEADPIHHVKKIDVETVISLNSEGKASLVLYGLDSCTVCAMSHDEFTVADNTYGILPYTESMKDEKFSFIATEQGEMNIAVV